MSTGDTMSMFDTYTLRARLCPALLTGLPAAAVVGVLFPGIEWWHAGLMSTGAAVGLTFLLAQMARSAGKRKEPALFQGWGGKPTTRYLRHRDSPLDRHTLARYHRNIEKLDPALRMPSLEQENADPAGADAAYEAATRMLIGKTRDTKRFRLLFKENVHFGFCRNLWGLKPIGIGVAVVSGIVCAALVYREFAAAGVVARPAAVVGVVSLICVVLWCMWFTPGWIKVAADAYAERLLEASDALVADGSNSMTGSS